MDKVLYCEVYAAVEKQEKNGKLNRWKSLED